MNYKYVVFDRRNDELFALLVDAGDLEAFKADYTIENYYIFEIKEIEDENI